MYILSLDGPVKFSLVSLNTVYLHLVYKNVHIKYGLDNPVCRWPQLWSILQAVQSFLPLSIDEFITDSDQKVWINATRGQTFVEIVGGAEGKVTDFLVLPKGRVPLDLGNNELRRLD
jgi:hypothetical protein